LVHDFSLEFALTSTSMQQVTPHDDGMSGNGVIPRLRPI
jgi:hypothetical protein